MKKAKAGDKVTRAPADVDQRVGRNVRRYRIARETTLSDLGLQLGISHQQLQKYETGASRLSAGILLDLSRILGVSLAELFGVAGKEAVRRVTKEDRSRLRAII